MRGEHATALSLYTQALARDPSMLSAMMGRALVLLTVGEIENSLAECESALRRSPCSPRALCLRAKIRFMMGELSRALTDISSAIRLSCINASFFRNRACIYREMRQFDKALSDLDVAIALEPGFRLALSGRADVNLALGHWENASDDLRRALPGMEQINREGLASVGLDSHDMLSAYGYDFPEPIPHCAALVATAVGGQRTSQTRSHAEECRGACIPVYSAELSDLLVIRAELWKCEGKHEVALGDLHNALMCDGSNACAYNNRALLLLDIGRPLDALHDVDAALAEGFDSAVAHNNRAVILMSMRRYVEALADLDVATRDAPDWPNAYRNRARLLSGAVDRNVRDGGRAVADASRALDLCGEADCELLLVLAAAYAESGKLDCAADVLDGYSACACAENGNEGAPETSVVQWSIRSVFGVTGAVAAIVAILVGHDSYATAFLTFAVSISMAMTIWRRIALSSGNLQAFWLGCGAAFVIGAARTLHGVAEDIDAARNNGAALLMRQDLTRLIGGYCWVFAVWLITFVPLGGIIGFAMCACYRFAGQCFTMARALGRVAVLFLAARR